MKQRISILKRKGNRMRSSIMFMVTMAMLIGCSSQGFKQYNANVSAVQRVISNGGGDIGAPAPNFTWYDDKGQEVSFKEYTKGKPVLVNFWATWCFPCKVELPDLRALSKEYARKGTLVIGISIDQNVERDYMVDFIKKFANEWRLEYQMIIDDDNRSLWKAFGINDATGIPTTVMIDKNGRVSKAFVGAASKEQFAAEFDKLL